MAFEHIEQKHKLPRNNLFRFFQLRDYIKKKKTLLDNSTLSDIEKRVFHTERKMSVSILYNILKEYGKVEICKSTWEEELGVKITEDKWEEIWSNSQKISVCN